LTNYRDPQSAQWNLNMERELAPSLTLRESYVAMSSYRMSQTVDLNQLERSAMSPNPNPKPYSNWERILSTSLVAFNIATHHAGDRSGLVRALDCPL